MKYKSELGSIAVLAVLLWHLPSVCRATTSLPSEARTLAGARLNAHIEHFRQSLATVKRDYGDNYSSYHNTCNTNNQVLQDSGMTVPGCFNNAGQYNVNMSIGEKLRLYVPVLLGYHSAIVHVWAEESARHTNLSLLESIFHTACDLYHVIDDFRVLISLYGLGPDSISSCNILFNSNVTEADRVGRNYHLLCLTEDYGTYDLDLPIRGMLKFALGL